jgi:ferredoxin, 2Fe-2S
MPEITYITADGERIIEAEAGTSVMRAAVNNSVPGIIGECGGQAMCATCHVYVDETYLGCLPAPSDDEDEMLDFTAAARQENSRLGCQLKAGAPFEKIVVTIPGQL